MCQKKFVDVLLEKAYYLSILFLGSRLFIYSVNQSFPKSYFMAIKCSIKYPNQFLTTQTKRKNLTKRKSQKEE